MKKNMLYIVPVLPNPTGGGREMRAYTWIKHLQEKYVIHLVVTMPECNPSAALLKSIETIHFIHPVIEKKRKKIFQFLLFIFGLRKSPPVPHTINTSNENVQRLSELLFQFNINYVLIFRAGMIELGLQMYNILKPKIFEIDIDDIESLTHLSLAKIRFKNGYFIIGIKEFIRSCIFFYAEKTNLKKFDNTYVCTIEDQQYLSFKYNLKNVQIFSNQILFQETTFIVPAYPVFLFVGSLDYFPNEDAVLFLIKRILPQLKKLIQGSFEIIIAGKNAPKRLIKILSKFKEIKYMGEIEDMNIVYQKASVAVIPLRAGGGTKLKVLEAFLHKIPVIATKEAVRGLNLINQEHYLSASTAKEFAQVFFQLSVNSELENKLRNNAFQWLLDNHYVSK